MCGSVTLLRRGGVERFRIGGPMTSVGLSLFSAVTRLPLRDISALVRYPGRHGGGARRIAFTASTSYA